MGDFKKYLAEAVKQYDFIIKIAGDLEEGFENKLEMALQKFEVANLSAGKKTPIQSVPLDFPQLTNETVTVFDTTVNYPTTQEVLKNYLSSFLNVSMNNIRVRKPGEPYEEYQTQPEDTTYESKLQDGEYQYDNTEVNKDELVVTEKGKETFLQSLAKEANERQPGD